MNNFGPEIELTNDNWDDITNQGYHLTFLNERNAVRKVIYDLLQIDNEIKCTNIDIQNLKSTFECQLTFLEDEVKRLQENEYLELGPKNKLLAEHVAKIDGANLSNAKEIEKYLLIKEQKCQAISQNVEKLFKLKSQFKFTHQQQVESLNRFRKLCDPDIRSAVEIRLKSVNRKFCDELFYLCSCEKDLKHIFSLLDDKSSHSGIVFSDSSSTVTSQRYTEFFKDFSWLRNEQLTKRSESFEYFKKYLAKDIIAALAAVHIHSPDEPIKFIANYLKHLKQNEFRVINEARIYAHDDTLLHAHDGSLFPDNNKK